MLGSRVSALGGEARAGGLRVEPFRVCLSLYATGKRLPGLGFRVWGVLSC